MALGLVACQVEEVCHGDHCSRGSDLAAGLRVRIKGGMPIVAFALDVKIGLTVKMPPSPHQRCHDDTTSSSNCDHRGERERRDRKSVMVDGRKESQPFSPS